MEKLSLDFFNDAQVENHLSIVGGLVGDPCYTKDYSWTYENKNGQIECKIDGECWHEDKCPGEV
jgi:hypothetical protein